MRLEDIELRRQDEAIDIPKEAAHRVSIQDSLHLYLLKFSAASI